MKLITYSRFNIGDKKWIILALLGIGLGSLGGAGLAAASGGDKNQAADRFVHEILENEIRAQKEDLSLWQYQENKIENGKNERLEVVETREGDLERLVTVNGARLAPEPEKKEEARIHRLVSDRQAIQTEHRKQQEDVAQELKLLHMLANAFHYQDAGQDGKLRKVNFTPNPAFRPPTREGEVFHHMSGTLWLDVEQKRLARMSGTLTSEVTFGWGILGHLEKGGTFTVEQAEVGKGHWELTLLDVNMNGKALFFKTIDVKQNVKNSNFKSVPRELTLQRAAELLKSDSTTSARTMTGN
ncbi:MAG TPA: hypothetical protein VHS08_07020 [Candidatus Acidoferrales bacterium]|nr:hypothetical protein [Candidatus Acidoferrales bacterium]